MKTLQQYMSAEIKGINVYITEGFWSNIVKWLDKFFSSSDKKFDRYKQEGFDLTEYSSYLNEHFRKRRLKLKPVEEEVLSNIVCPNDIKPDEKSDSGFWDFEYEPMDPQGNYYSLIYEDSDCKDVVALIKINEEIKLYNNCAELIKIQILKEFQEFISIKDVIDFIKNQLGVSHNGLFVKKNENKDLYEYTINDCGFEKTRYMVDVNIAYKTFK